MVGHRVAPMWMSSEVITPFGKFTCNSTADFFVRYVIPTDNPTIDNHIPRIYEELDMLKEAIEEMQNDKD